MRFITEKELKQIIDILSAYDFMDAEIKASLYLMFFTGARINELLELKDCDVNLKERFVTYNNPYRIIYFSEQVGKHLKYVKEPSLKKDSFFSFNKEKMTYLISAVRKHWKEDFLMDTLSDSFIVNLINKKVDVRAIEYLSGRTLLYLRQIYKLFPLKKTDIIKEARKLL